MAMSDSQGNHYLINDGEDIHSRLSRFKMFKSDNSYMFFCGKCRTLKTSSQTVSVQVQHVRYQSQTGHDTQGYNYQRHYRWARSL